MNSLTVRVRSAARKLGVICIINRMRSQRPYEDRFHASLQQCIHPGDVVWDVGANIGFYSQFFSEWTGPTGSVVAFEPVPATFEQIRSRFVSSPTVHVECCALGSVAQETSFVTAEYNETSHAIRAGETIPDGSWEVPVRIVTGDEVAERLGKMPNVVKIDVEGYEEDVLLGMKKALSSPQLRSICVEVHFHQLETRGQANAPVRIERLLRKKGFETSWTDRSHLTATRPFALKQKGFSWSSVALRLFDTSRFVQKDATSLAGIRQP